MRGGGQSLVDIPNRPESPYKPATLFAASALHDQAITYTPSFIIPSSLLLSNFNTAGNGIAALFIDLDDGNGLQLITPDEAITAQYNSAGKKKIKLKVVTLNQGKFDCHFSFEIVDSNLGFRYPNSPTNISIPATAEHSGGVMNVFINDCNEGLTKPLIIVDGLDPLSRDEARTWEFAIELLGFDVDASNQLLDILEDEGYDVIFIDYNNGGDYIQRNARMVQDALEEINQRKAANGSQERSIVIGPSMGGPVSEYALLEMEQNGEDHEVESLLLLDGVQRGANVPLGIQHAAKHMYSLSGPGGVPLSVFVKSLKQLENLFNEPALRQMLLYNANSPDGVSPLPEHTQLYNELDAFAPPQDFEYVALSAGSIRGTGQLVNPGETIVNFSGSLNDILTDLVGGWSDFWATTVEFVGVIFGTTAGLEITINSLPGAGSGASNIYYGRLEASILSQVIGYLSIYSYNVGGTLPLDSAPGGFMGINRDSVSLSEQQLIYNTMCIVPTVSSLDIPVTGANLYSSLEDIESVTGSLTALDNYSGSTMLIESTEYGPPAQENQQHSPIINITSIDFLLYNFTSSDPLASALGVIDDRFYNFGRSLAAYDPSIPDFFKETDNVVRYDIDILNGGGLWVNFGDRIAFTDQLQNPENQRSSNFNLYIGGSDVCTESQPVTVSIHNSSVFEIGHWDAGAGIENTGHVYVLDQAAVDIKSNGLLEVNKQSQFVIQEGGQAFVRNGGVLEAQFGGKVRIEDGGEIRVEAGGKLRVTQKSAVVVEPGGKLILEPGAVVELWEESEPGLAVVEIKGELEVQGEFDFIGNGFFDFYAGHTLSLPGGIFKIAGRGFGQRFMRLQPSARVQIGDANLELSEGLVEYLSGSKIEVGAGEVRASTIHFVGFGAVAALDLTATSAVRLFDCQVDGFGAGVTGRDILPVQPFGLYFVDCDFADNDFSIFMERANLLRAVRCDFNGGGGNTALALHDVGSARLSQCDIYDHGVGGAGTPAIAAVEVRNVDELVISGGFLRDNDIGVHCPDGYRANVMVRNQAEVSNNIYGIWIEQGQINGVNDFGLVTFDCAKLLNNTLSGVKGKDITLNIDAYINAQTDDPQYARANHFQRSVATLGKWFDICYTSPLGQQIQTIPARGNFWGSDNANPDNGTLHYGIHHVSASCGPGGSEVGLNFSDKASEAPTGCPVKPITDQDHFPPVIGGLCGLQIGNHELLSGVMADALAAYFHQLDIDETTDGTHSLFNAVAAMSNQVRDSLAEDCRHLIDVARIFANMGDGYAAMMALPQSGQANRDSDARLQVYPNPTDGLLNLELPARSSYTIRAYSLDGKEVLSELAPGGSHQIGTDLWAEGLYVLQVMELSTGEKWEEKVVIQR